MTWIIQGEECIHSSRPPLALLGAGAFLYPSASTAGDAWRIISSSIASNE